MGYSDLQNACPLNARVGAQTVSDLARGVRWGSRKSWQRCADGINSFTGRTNYTTEELTHPSTERYQQHWSKGMV